MSSIPMLCSLSDNAFSVLCKQKLETFFRGCVEKRNNRLQIVTGINPCGGGACAKKRGTWPERGKSRWKRGAEGVLSPNHLTISGGIFGVNRVYQRKYPKKFGGIVGKGAKSFLRNHASRPEKKLGQTEPRAPLGTEKGVHVIQSGQRAAP